jgi:hypothetical protein
MVVFSRLFKLACSELTRSTKYIQSNKALSRNMSHTQLPCSRKEIDAMNLLKVDLSMMGFLKTFSIWCKCRPNNIIMSQ